MPRTERNSNTPIMEKRQTSQLWNVKQKNFTKLGSLDLINT